MAVFWGHIILKDVIYSVYSLKNIGLHDILKSYYTQENVFGNIMVREMVDIYLVIKELMAH